MTSKNEKNEKDKTTRVTGSKIGVLGDFATIYGGIHFHHSQNNKGGTVDPENIKMQKNHAVFDPSNTANILHLSDLHFGADKQSDPLSDASRWCGQLSGME